jgi:hypothetical protein
MPILGFHILTYMITLHEYDNVSSPLAMKPLLSSNEMIRYTRPSTSITYTGRAFPSVLKQLNDGNRNIMTRGTNAENL